MIIFFKKCLYGHTQNNNESLNGIIWKQCSKDVFIGQLTLEMGVASVVISFNDGKSGILKVMENLSMNPGENCIRYCNEKDNTRIKEMEKKSTPEVRHRRKQLCAQCKGFADIAEQNEGGVYGAGLFWLFWNTHFNLDNVFLNLSILLNGTIYISFLKKHHFSYILFCSKMMIYSKNMICKKIYRKMFNKHEIRDWTTFELKLYELFLK